MGRGSAHSRRPVQPSRTVPSVNPGEERRPSLDGLSSPGPLCWQCERWAVDTDGDFCDECLDQVAEELEQRMIGSGW